MGKNKIINWMVLIAVVAAVIYFEINRLSSNKQFDNRKEEIYNLIELSKEYINKNSSDINKNIYDKIEKSEKITDGIIYVDEDLNVNLVVIYEAKDCYIKLSDEDINNRYSPSVCIENFKESVELIKQEKLENYIEQNEKIYSENISYDAYGYAVTNNSSETSLYELRKSGEKVKVAECTGDCKIYGLYSSNEKFYFIINHLIKKNNLGTETQSYETLFSIDVAYAELEILSKGNQKILPNNNYYAVGGDYLFTPNNDLGIKKINLKTKEITSILSDVDAREMFVYNDKLYIYTYIFGEYAEDDLIEYYETDFDGNFVKITEKEYKDVLKLANYVNEYSNNMHYYYKDKLVSLEDNKMIVNDEIIYQAANDSFLEWRYLPSENMVFFEQYTFDDKSQQSATHSGYYEYNLDTGILEKLSDEINIDFNKYEEITSIVLFR